LLHQLTILLSPTIIPEETMNKTELVDAIEAALPTRKDAVAAVEAVINAITHAVAKGEKVTLSGFGTFEKALRAARVGRNPRTGESVRIKKTAVPKFKAGTTFKGAVANPRSLPKTAKIVPAAKRPVRVPAAGTAAPTTAPVKTTKGAPVPARAAAKKATPATATPAKASAGSTTGAAKTAAPSKVAVAKAAPVKSSAAKTATTTTAVKATAKKASPAGNTTAAKKVAARKVPATNGSATRTPRKTGATTA
jgi:DNA-binding protein HU-beta